MSRDLCQRRALLTLACVLAVNALGCRQAETIAHKQTPSSALFASSPKPQTPPADAKRDVAFTIARSLEAEGNTQKAIQAYQSVVDAYEMPAAYHRLAVLHDLREDFKSSAKHYQEALRRDPENPRVLCDLGYSYYLQQRLTESERVLRQAIAASPADPLAHNNLGLVLGAAGRFDEAFEHFAAVSASKAEARVNLSYTMLRNQQVEQAEKQLQLALREDPELPAARSLLASLPQQGQVDASQQNTEENTTLAKASLLSRQRNNAVRPVATTAPRTRTSGSPAPVSSSQSQLKIHSQERPRDSSPATGAPTRLPNVPDSTPPAPDVRQRTDEMVRRASANASVEPVHEAKARAGTSQMSIVSKETAASGRRDKSDVDAPAVTSVVAEEYAILRSDAAAQSAASGVRYSAAKSAAANQLLSRNSIRSTSAAAMPATPAVHAGGCDASAGSAPK